ncbi:MAG: hypothetical protein RMX96_27765 [Nostoc sp. ChiSLP02]|nr:hypothetical protein [Nostoc sp. DedSLP05]MDZ8098364.1 hypothetical protein [Nostoc sp. DedSLP01]MDZ8188638.1 hypothetical protein [Nostoc sp. ChiSLP02]
MPFLLTSQRIICTSDRLIVLSIPENLHLIPRATREQIFKATTAIALFFIYPLRHQPDVFHLSTFTSSAFSVKSDRYLPSRNCDF